MAIGRTAVGIEWLLDYVNSQISNPETTWLAMDTLFNGLHELRQRLTPEDWQWTISNNCMGHPLQAALNEDPITHRAFNRPRGYSGDAVLLDLIYQHPTTQGWIDEAPNVGKQVFAYTIDAPAARAVRLRRDLITRMIDEVAADVQLPHILSVACGHMREAAISKAMNSSKIGRYVGLDHDLETIQYGQTKLRALGIEFIHGNALQLLKNELDLGKFDFIYVSGLFDYLKQSTGQRLVAAIFHMLNPGGRMLISNAVTGMRDTGYMEAFMNWNLIYRDCDELVDLAARINHDDIAAQDVFREENQNWGFLHLRRS